MAKCHNSVDSLSPPRRSLHSGVPAKSTRLPVETAGIQAAVTRKQAPPVYVLVDSARCYFGRTPGLCGRTEHSAVSVKAASLIPTSIG
jgi:hypothetical protein